MSRQDVLDTIWEVPDDLWEEIEPEIRELDPPKGTGRKREDPRKMLNAIIFRMRSGCQWSRLPKCLGDDSTIHRNFPEVGIGRGFPQRSGPLSKHTAMSWVVWTGSGNRLTPRWARLVWVGVRSDGIQQTEASPGPNAASWWKQAVDH